MKKRLICILRMLTIIVSLCGALTASVWAWGPPVIYLDNFYKIYECLEDIEEGTIINVSSPLLDLAVNATVNISTPCTINFSYINFMQPRNDDGESFCYDPFIEVNARHVTLNFDHCSFDTKEAYDKNRVSSERGAAIHVDGDDCHINGNGTTTFRNCITSAKYGGAIYIDDLYSGCRISDCNFESCEAKKNGGAIYAADDDCVIINCTFSNCKANGVDSYVYGEEENQTTLVNCKDSNGNPCNSSNCPGCHFSNGSGSIFSEGYWWIICIGAVVILGGIVTMVIVKKKKPALADGAETGKE